MESSFELFMNLTGCLNNILVLTFTQCSRCEDGSNCIFKIFEILYKCTIAKGYTMIKKNRSNNKNTFHDNFSYFTFLLI